MVHFVLIETCNTGQIIDSAFSFLMVGDEGGLGRSKDLIDRLPNHERIIVFYALVRSLSAQKLSNVQGRSESATKDENREIRGSSALIAALADHDQTLQDGLGSWLIGISAPSTGFDHTTHRAVIAALACDTGKRIPFICIEYRS